MTLGLLRFTRHTAVIHKSIRIRLIYHSHSQCGGGHDFVTLIGAVEGLSYICVLSRIGEETNAGFQGNTNIGSLLQLSDVQPLSAYQCNFLNYRGSAQTYTAAANIQIAILDLRVAANGHIAVRDTNGLICRITSTDKGAAVNIDLICGPNHTASLCSGVDTLECASIDIQHAILRYRKDSALTGTANDLTFSGSISNRQGIIKCIDLCCANQGHGSAVQVHLDLAAQITDPHSRTNGDIGVQIPVALCGELAGICPGLPFDCLVAAIGTIGVQLSDLAAHAANTRLCRLSRQLSDTTGAFQRNLQSLIRSGNDVVILAQQLKGFGHIRAVCFGSEDTGTCRHKANLCILGQTCDVQNDLSLLQTQFLNHRSTCQIELDRCADVGLDAAGTAAIGISLRYATGDFSGILNCQAAAESKDVAAAVGFAADNLGIAANFSSTAINGNVTALHILVVGVDLSFSSDIHRQNSLAVRYSTAVDLKGGISGNIEVTAASAGNTAGDGTAVHDEGTLIADIDIAAIAAVRLKAGVLSIIIQVCYPCLAVLDGTIIQRKCRAFIDTHIAANAFFAVCPFVCCTAFDGAAVHGDDGIRAASRDGTANDGFTANDLGIVAYSQAGTGRHVDGTAVVNCCAAVNNGVIRHSHDCVFAQTDSRAVVGFSTNDLGITT